MLRSRLPGSLRAGRWVRPDSTSFPWARSSPVRPVHQVVGLGAAGVTEGGAGGVAGIGGDGGVVVSPEGAGLAGTWAGAAGAVGAASDGIVVVDGAIIVWPETIGA